MNAPERLAEREPPPDVPEGRASSGGRAVLRAARQRLPATLPLLACAAAAWASLAVPAVIGYDPWVWLVWGRELTGGLPTTDGSITWKPLPVLLTTPLALFGDAAPQLWTVLVRTAGLFGLVSIFRLAAHYAGALAGVVGVLAFLLTPDSEARWIRHMLQANIEPVSVMLCLVAVQRHIDGRRGQAILFGAAAGLTRPEAWPFLLGYAGYAVWRAPRLARVALPAVAAVPTLWFGGDWLLSGDPAAGAGIARVLTVPAADRFALAADAVAGAVIGPVWVAAAVAMAWSAYRRRVGPLLLGAGALGWAGIVVVMAGALGYAALGRFLAPAAALLCVLAGIAVAWSVTAVRPVLLRPVVLVALVAAAVPFAVPRAQWLPVQLATAQARAVADADLDAVVAAAGGRDRMLACGTVSVEAMGAALEVRPRLVWSLEVPLATVRAHHDPGPLTAIVQAGGALDAGMAALPDAAQEIGRSRYWAAYAYQCPAPPS